MKDNNYFHASTLHTIYTIPITIMSDKLKIKRNSLNT